MKKSILSLIIVITCSAVYAGGYYVSKNDGDWNDPNTWNAITYGKKDYPTKEDKVLIIGQQVKCSNPYTYECNSLEIILGGQLMLVNEVTVKVNGNVTNNIGGTIFMSDPMVDGGRINSEGQFLNYGNIAGIGYLFIYSKKDIINYGSIHILGSCSLSSFDGINDISNLGEIIVTDRTSFSSDSLINNGNITAVRSLNLYCRTYFKNNGLIEVQQDTNSILAFIFTGSSPSVLQDGPSATWKINNSCEFKIDAANQSKFYIQSPQLIKSLSSVSTKRLYLNNKTRLVYNLVDTLSFSYCQMQNSEVEINKGYLQLKQIDLWEEGYMRVNGGIVDLLGFSMTKPEKVSVEVQSGICNISLRDSELPANINIAGGAINFLEQSIQFSKLTMTGGRLIFSIPNTYVVLHSSDCKLTNGRLEFGEKSTGKMKQMTLDIDDAISLPTLMVGNLMDSVNLLVNGTTKFVSVNDLYIAPKTELKWDDKSCVLTIADTLFNKGQLFLTNKIIFKGKYLYSSSPLFFSKFIANEADHAEIDARITVQDTLRILNSQLDLKGNVFSLGSTFSTALPVRIQAINGWIYNGQIRKWINSSWDPSDSEFSIGSYFPIGSATGSRPLFVNYLDLPTKSGFINVGFDETGLTSGVMFRDGADIIRARRNDSWTISTVGITGGKYELTAIYPFLPGVGDINDLRVTLYNGVIGKPGRNSGSISYPNVSRTNLSVGDLSHSFFISSINSFTSPLSLLSSISPFIESGNDKNIKVYPNPLLENEQEFVISLPDYFLEEEKIIVNIELINNVGEIVYSQQAIEVSSDLKIEIKNVVISKGVYILKLISENQIYYRRLLVE